MKKKSIKDDIVKDCLGKLRKFYRQIPDTKGCMESLEKGENGCGAWCCLHPETRIYTDIGLVPISDITSGQMVWTIGGLKKVIKTGSRYIEEDIVNIKTCYGRSIKTTKDHLILTDTFGKKQREKPKEMIWVKASELIAKREHNKGHFLIFPKINIKNNKQYRLNIDEYTDCYVKNGECYASSFKRGQKIASSIELDEQFCWILGLYLAEGSSSLDSIDFHINSDEIFLKEKINLFAKKFGFYCSWKINRGKSLTVRIFSRILAKLFKKICGSGCENKKLAFGLFKNITNNINLLRALHDGYYCGDGTKKLSKKSKYSVTTTSRELMYQIMMINHILKEIPSLFNGHPKNKKEYWTLAISDGKYKDYVETNLDIRVPVKDIEIISYKGLVYDLEIENGESFFTEGGEVHNCKVQCPPFLYIEFLNTWNFIVHNWTMEKTLELIEDCLKMHVSQKITKGCVLWDSNTKLCKSHNTRPFNCRIYGITPNSEIQPRIEKFREIYKKFPDVIIKDQCPLVSTIDGVEIKSTDAWWTSVTNIEQKMGVDAKDIVNKDGGSYLLFHDHLLLHICSEKALASLPTTFEEIAPFMAKFRKNVVNILEK